jgi:hypothetical protein
LITYINIFLLPVDDGIQIDYTLNTWIGNGVIIPSNDIDDFFMFWEDARGTSYTWIICSGGWRFYLF